MRVNIQFELLGLLYYDLFVLKTIFECDFKRELFFRDSMFMKPVGRNLPSSSSLDSILGGMPA